MNIFLNGASSAGKTSIARSLQRQLSGPYIVYSRDMFHQTLPPEFWHDSDLRKQAGPSLFKGFHLSMAAFAEAGVPIIIDHVLNQNGWAVECAEVLDGIPTLFVGVMCPLDILKERERAREDRDEGLARSQIEKVHSHGAYDFTVDTSKNSAVNCARKIAERFSQGNFKALNNILRHHHNLKASNAIARKD